MLDPSHIVMLALAVVSAYSAWIAYRSKRLSDGARLRKELFELNSERKRENDELKADKDLLELRVASLEQELMIRRRSEARLSNRLQATSLECHRLRLAIKDLHVEVNGLHEKMGLPPKYPKPGVLPDDDLPDLTDAEIDEILREAADPDVPDFPDVSGDH